VTTYTVARGGERIDRIARKIFGSERGGTTEALLDANPGLAALGLAVPEGTVLAVPIVPEKPSATYQLAWE
jgi:phage tail protein X